MHRDRHEPVRQLESLGTGPTHLQKHVRRKNRAVPENTYKSKHRKLKHEALRLSLQPQCGERFLKV